jgi:glutamate formiminotransferase
MWGSMAGDAPLLLAVPNVSEGRDRAAIEAIAGAFTASGGARLLDVHADGDHHRAVLTLAGRPGSLADALAGGAAEAVRRIDVGGRGARSGARAGAPEDKLPSRRSGLRGGRPGQHPHVGALDVVPVVYLDPALRGAACAEALVAAQEIGEGLGVPVFLYGELAGTDRRSTEAGRRSPRTDAGDAGFARTPESAGIPVSAITRAQLRRGGVAGLARRMRSGELRPDFGPPAMHPTAGATLVGARGPLVAFNLELAPPATVAQARHIAALIREGGAEGVPGVRAIGVALHEGSTAGVGAQVSMNVERPTEVPLREVIEAVRRHAPVARAELVGLAPAAALEGFPEDLAMPGFDPARHVLENALSAGGRTRSRTH